MRVYKVVKRWKDRLYSACYLPLRRAGWCVEYLPHQWALPYPGSKLFACRSLEEARRLVETLSVDGLDPSYEIWEAEAEGTDSLRWFVLDLTSWNLQKFWEKPEHRRYIPCWRFSPGWVAADRLCLLRKVELQESQEEGGSR